MKATYFFGSSPASRISSRWRMVSGHLGGRDQVEVAVAGGRLEEVALELGQLAGPGERVRGDEIGRDDLPVAPRAVQVQHELDERPLEARPQVPVDGEARPGDPGRALEVEDAELGPEVPVRLRGEVEGARRADPPHLDVVRGVLSDGHARVGHVRHDEQEPLDRCLHLLEPRVARLDPVGDALHLGLEVRRVLLRLAAPGDLLPGQALAVAQLLHLLDEGAALGVEGPGVHPGEAGEGLHVVQALPAAREHGEDGLAVLHDVLEVQHGRAG